MFGLQVYSHLEKMDNTFFDTTRQDVFYSTGTFSWLRLSLKRCFRIPHSWSTQIFRILGLTPSGPAALFSFSPFNCLLACLLETDIQEGGASSISWCSWRQQWSSSNIYDWGGRWDSWDVTGKLWVKGGWEICLAGGRRGGCWACLWTEPIEQWLHVIG